MGFSNLESLSHGIENVLECIKSGAVAPSNQNISIIMRTMDSIRGAVADVSHGGSGMIKFCDLMIDLLRNMSLGIEMLQPLHVVSSFSVR